jgi:hypothetical protein
MSANPPEGLDASTLIARISSGEVPHEAMMLAAQGFLPIPQEELIEVLVFLARQENTEVVETARRSLKDLPSRIILTYARSATDPLQLDALSKATGDAVILEAVIRNRATADTTVEAMAATVAPALQEVIVINQDRIIRHGAIIDALLANPTLAADVRRRALEAREEFFEKKQASAEAAAAIAAELELNAQQAAELEALLQEAEKFGDEVIPDFHAPEAEESETDTPNESAFRKISRMTVSQKVMLAFRGGMTERGILVRSRIRMVASAVLKSPRLTETEVENFASLRNVEDEVLRLIGMNRQWMAKYNIMLILVKNPKAPVGVVLPLINRLTLRDLKNLSGDRGVSDTIRQASRRLYIQRKATQ